MASVLARTLLASLWHGLFFHRGCPPAGTSEQRVQDVLALLAAAGFTRAGDAQRADREAVQAACAELRTLLSKHPRQQEDEGGRAHDWLRSIAEHGATAYLSDHGEAAVPSLGHALRQAIGAQAPPPQADSLVEVLVRQAATPAAGTAPQEVLFPMLFALHDVPLAAQPSAATKDDSHHSHSSSSSSTGDATLYTEAKLYAALCLLSGFVAVKPLATLLVAYIHQEDAVVAEAVQWSTRGRNEAAEQHSKPHSPTLVGRTATRARGVVAGLLELALETARGSSHALRQALSAASANPQAALDEMDDASSAVWALPRPEQSRAVRLAAALVLAQLPRLTSELHAGRPGPAGGDAVDGALMAQETLHAVQELLFTITLGAGTVAMPNRPGMPPQPQAAAPWRGRVNVTHRPLTIREADAVLCELLPSLLQQVGFEWPWSEMLRQCRALDKQQAAPAFPFVALPSSLVVETILLRVAARTYPQRLQNLLPESYDRLLDKLSLRPRAVAADEQDDGADAEKDRAATADAAALFKLPDYYKDAVPPLLEYFGRAGLGGLRCAEVRRLLSHAVSTLPMVVRLRALAPPDDDGDNDDDDDGGSGEDGAAPARGRAYPLSAARAAALEKRYTAEVLLVAVIVHTQLRTHSQVQGMMRELSPLLSELTLALSRAAGSLTAPLLAHGSGAASGRRALSFTKEAERLIDDVGYQFYPLEWLPAAADALHAQQTRTATALASSLARGPSLPYSVYAAVAHQLRASFRSSPGDGSSISPSGLRASVVVGGGAAAGASPTLLPPSSASAESAVDSLKRAERLFDSLMLPCWLQSALSSCSLEGTIAVAATRVVSGGAGDAGGAGGGAAARDGSSLARLHSLLKPAVLEKFWASTHTGVKRGRECADEDSGAAREQRPAVSATGSGSGAAADKEAEAVRELTEALLRDGAASYRLVLDASDFVLAVAQCFLPSTCSSEAASGTASALLQAAEDWCRVAIGRQSTRAELSMLAQQSPQLPLPARYNSCTLDACALSRRVLFDGVPSRLLEKMRARQQQTTELTARRDRCVQQLRGEERDEQRAEQHKERDVADVDPLLLYQWTQFSELLRRFGWTSEAERVAAAAAGGEAMGSGPSQELSVAQWLWYSPYASD